MNPTRVHTQDTIDTRVLILSSINLTPVDKIAEMEKDIAYIEYCAGYAETPAMPEVLYYWNRLCPLGRSYWNNGT